MDGAKLLSAETSRVEGHHRRIAIASRHRGSLDPKLEVKLAIAAGGRLTNLEGADFPSLIDGVCVGAVGVGPSTRRAGDGAEVCTRCTRRALEREIIVP